MTIEWEELSDIEGELADCYRALREEVQYLRQENQEMQARIKELEGCMETPRIEDLERIAELEDNEKELRKAIAGCRKMKQHLLSRNERLDAALSDIENLDINMSIVQKIIDKARAGE